MCAVSGALVVSCVLVFLLRLLVVRPLQVRRLVTSGEHLSQSGDCVIAGCLSGEGTRRGGSRRGVSVRSATVTCATMASTTESAHEALPESTRGGDDESKGWTEDMEARWEARVGALRADMLAEMQAAMAARDTALRASELSGRSATSTVHAHDVERGAASGARAPLQPRQHVRCRRGHRDQLCGATGELGEWG